MFIVLLSFSSSLATQCVSLGTEPVMTSPTLINVNYKGNGSCNAVNDLSTKISSQ